MGHRHSLALNPVAKTMTSTSVLLPSVELDPGRA